MVGKHDFFIHVVPNSSTEHSAESRMLFSLSFRSIEAVFDSSVESRHSWFLISNLYNMSTIFRRMYKTKKFMLSILSLIIVVFQTRPKFMKICFLWSLVLLNSLLTKKEDFAVGHDGRIPLGGYIYHGLFLDNEDYKPLFSEVILSLPK